MDIIFTLVKSLKQMFQLVRVTFPALLMNTCQLRPFHSNLDLAISEVQRMEPALHEQCPLEPEGRDQEVEPHSTEAVALQEGHQEAKPNKDHHMNILKTCGKDELEQRNSNPINICRTSRFIGIGLC